MAAVYSMLHNMSPPQVPTLVASDFFKPCTVARHQQSPTPDMATSNFPAQLPKRTNICMQQPFNFS